jgi:glycosyltransferase involved in cell wall biosynthesis
MQPTVSIVIPFFNCPYVDQAIASALQQTYENLEVIVVDDGSTRHQDKIEPFLDRIHYLGKQNGGTGSALNHGFRMASGTYIAWLSSDDWFYPRKIERQVRFMEKNGYRISHTDFHNMDASGAITAMRAAVKFRTEREFITSFLSCCPVNGCTIMMRKDLFLELGGFDETLLYTHDYDLWIRAILAGESFAFLDEPLTAYRWHDDMGTRKHWPHIVGEIGLVQARYGVRLRQLLDRYLAMGRI